MTTSQSNYELIKRLLKIGLELLGVTVRSMYLFSPGIIFLLIYYFTIVFFSIGQDMLIQAGEYTWPKIFTALSVILWMLLAWLSLRLISNTFIHKNKDLTPIEKKIMRHAPRFLGYNVAVGLQIAVINLPSLRLNGEGMQTMLFWGLLAFHTFYYYILHHSFQSKSPAKYRIWALVFGVFYVVALWLTFTFRGRVDLDMEGDNRHLSFWLIISIFYFLCQIIFLRIAIVKRRRSNDGVQDEGKSTNNLSQPTLWKIIYIVSLVLALGLYCIIAYSPAFANEFGSLGCLLLAMGLWVTFICIIKQLAIRFNMRFTLMILVAAILVGRSADPYKVNLLTDDEPDFYKSRMDADAYIDKWFALRKNQIETANQKGEAYPVYLILSDGGASKSGFWVASVLSKLEEESKTDRFSSHLLSLSGASGGAVGNAAFYCNLVAPYKVNNYTTPKWQSKYPAAAFMETDFLTYSLSHFLGPDLLGHLIPTHFYADRAAALEIAMECSDYNPQIGKQFNEPIEKVIDTTGRFPMLFINVTNVDLGSPGLISSVKFGSFSHRTDVLSEVDMDKDKALDGDGKPKRIKLSTAAVLGARFPYISPAGEINNNYFVDGGYYDNSGAGVTLELMRNIEKRMNKQGDVLQALKGKVCFKAIYISNGLDGKDGTRIHPLLNDFAAPLLTVLGTYSNQTNLGNRKLQDFLIEIDNTHYTYEAVRLPKNPKDLVSYPMNWVLSDYNINRMNRNLELYKSAEILGIKYITE